MEAVEAGKVKEAATAEGGKEVAAAMVAEARESVVPRAVAALVAVAKAEAKGGRRGQVMAGATVAVEKAATRVEADMAVWAVAATVEAVRDRAAKEATAEDYRAVVRWVEEAILGAATMGGVVKEEDRRAVGTWAVELWEAVA